MQSTRIRLSFQNFNFVHFYSFLFFFLCGGVTRFTYLYNNVYSMTEVSKYLKQFGVLAGTKILSEQIGNNVKFIGNGTPVSVGLKAVIGIGCLNVKEPYVKAIGGGFMLDALEDLIDFGMKKTGITASDEEAF